MMGHETVHHGTGQGPGELSDEGPQNRERPRVGPLQNKPFARAAQPFAIRLRFHCRRCLIFITINSITGTMISVRKVAKMRP